VIIKTGFADRHHFFGAAPRHQLGPRHVEFLMRVMWMRAERTINVGKAFRDREYLRVLPHARRDRHHPLDPSVAGARHHGIELVGKVGKIEVAMTIDQHVCLLRPCARRLDIARENCSGRGKLCAGGNAVFAAEE
jgi:hypothetical protein